MRISAVVPVLLLLPAAASQAETRLLMTAIEQRSGKPVTDLKAEELTVTDDKTARSVVSLSYTPGPIDVMLMVDTSLVGGMVAPLAERLIAQIDGKEQMAIVSFADSAEMLQDFTATKERLMQSLSQVKFGNQPQILDALYAAINGGFENAAYRRVILLLTAGIEGYSRVNEKEVFRLARRNGVSIYPVYVAGTDRGLFEKLARMTGGASFNLRDMTRNTKESPAPRIFEVLRAHYVLTLRGNQDVSEKLKIEARRQEKLLLSALPLE